MKHLFRALDLKRYTHAHNENGACEAITHTTTAQFREDKCCNLLHLCMQKAGAVASMACFAWPPHSLQLPFTLLPREIILFDNLAGVCHAEKCGRSAHSVSRVRALGGGSVNPLHSKRGKKKKRNLGPNNRILGVLSSDTKFCLTAATKKAVELLLNISSFPRYFLFIGYSLY